MGRLDGLGLIPLSEVEDLPDVVEDAPVDGEELRDPGAAESLEEEVRGP